MRPTDLPLWSLRSVPPGTSAVMSVPGTPHFFASPLPLPFGLPLPFAALQSGSLDWSSLSSTDFDSIRASGVMPLPSSIDSIFGGLLLLGLAATATSAVPRDAQRRSDEQARTSPRTRCSPFMEAPLAALSWRGKVRA